MSWGRRQKGICGVQLDNRKVLRALVPRTKYFECLFFCRLANNKLQQKIQCFQNDLVLLNIL